MHKLRFRQLFSNSTMNMISSSISKNPSLSSTSGFHPSSRSFVSWRGINHLGNMNLPTSRNFISWKKDHLGSPISVCKRPLSLKASSDSQNGVSGSASFQVNGCGIDSMAEIFLDFGYTRKDELRFPAKKLNAYWFSPPTASFEEGSGINGPLPRVFISELRVDQMSSEAQDIIRKYTGISGEGKRYAALASALGSLTWERPLYSEFQQLARESEYAAWTLVNGYALNHVTISVHRLKSQLRSINSLNQFIEENGFKLNSEGGILKVSPDGFLLQSSTVADSMPFHFSDGITKSVPCSYIEFAERLVLPQYKNLPDEEVKEFHRRDGFEVGNADKIFESTSREQLTRRAA